MYKEFYNLSTDPFMLSPDHRFAFPHRSYVKAKTHMEFGLMRNEGVVIVTGDPGTGKSTVINDLLADYEDDDLLVAKMIACQLELDDLLRMLAYAFGINAEGLDKASMISQIEKFLSKQFEIGRRVLLIIDEAQHLSEQMLEELRLLTNIQHNHQTPFQIFLLGQPQLKALVNSPAMEQLRQRIIASCEFELLDAGDTREYIEHRLKIAGWEGDPEITSDAIQLVHRSSGGVPRKINMLCSRLLLYGSVDNKHRLTGEDMHQVIEELPAEMLNYLRTQESECGSTRFSYDAENQAPTEQILNQPAARTDTRISALSKAIPSEQTSTRTVSAEFAMSTGSDARERSSTAHRSAASMSAEEHHRCTPRDLSNTDTVTFAHGMSAQAKHADSGRPPTATSSTETVPLAHSEDIQYPFKPRIPRGRPLPYAQLRKKRKRRLSLTAVIVFAVVFASSYTYLTWSPDEIAGWLPKLHAFVAEHVQLPGNVGRDTSSSDASYAGGETNTNSTASAERAEPPENNQGTQEIEQWANLGQADRLSDAVGDPKERIVSPSRVNLPEQPDRIDSGDLKAEVAMLEKPPPRPREDTVSVPATPAEGFATGGLDPQQARLPDPREPSEEQAVALARRDRTNAIDSGVVERGGKWVISRDLERALRAHSLKTQRMPDGSVKITLHGVVPTQAGRVQLGARTSQSLEKLAFVLRNYAGFTVQIVANADPTDNKNAQLLRRRVQVIAKSLIVHGVPVHRVHTEARGEHEPLIAMSNTRKSQRDDREIEIYLRPTA